MLAKAGRLRLHFLVKFNCWRQLLAFTSTLHGNSIGGDSRSHTSPLFSGIQLLATAGRLHHHFSVEFNCLREQVAYTSNFQWIFDGWRQQVTFTSTFQWNSIDGDSRSHTSPLFSGIRWAAKADRTHLHLSVEFNRWRQQDAFITTSSDIQ